MKYLKFISLNKFPKAMEWTQKIIKACNCKMQTRTLAGKKVKRIENRKKKDTRQDTHPTHNWQYPPLHSDAHTHTELYISKVDQ